MSRFSPPTPINNRIKFLFSSLLVVLCVSLTACSKEAAPTAAPGAGRPAPLVVTGTVAEQFIVDEIDAIGTLQANESVIISAAVTEPVASVNFVDGQHVKKGDILVTLISDEQTAELAEAQANLQDAIRQLKRLEGIGSNLASKSDIDAARTRVDANQGKLEAIKARLKDRLITAPFSGVLGFRQVSVGALVTPGTEITTLDDISVVKLDFTIPEIYLGKIHSQNLVSGQSPAWPGEAFNGRVTSLDSRVDPDTRAIRVRAEIPNAEHKLRPGMLVNVTLYTDQYPALVVEESALIQTGNRSSVYVVKEDATVELRTVAIAKRLPGLVVVSSGVERGETIVVDGTLNLRPGAKVRIAGSEQSSLVKRELPSSDHRS
ncbi:efflux RND transporter periplasmic adaptor subunit [Halioxenophilus sp. WMMB6]|uniref:efflux RND transporter periplasmic adaptor subunit n=1 Tax=Halioxenophilus sp. WMMB6 TaxID=3073815 RepID=UPI00295ED797|nr:efflux RND transporter periplasmic adaptor subunit [Halioxenophilus sp. WMMB6]